MKKGEKKGKSNQQWMEMKIKQRKEAGIKI